MTTATRAVPFQRLRIITGILLALTFIVALVSLSGVGVLSGAGIWPFLAVPAVSVAVNAITHQRPSTCLTDESR